MTRLVAFLRAINVGGHVVKMDALKGHFTALGFTDVETFIASGNVVFSAGGAVPALTRRIESRLEDALGYAVPTFVRTAAEVAAIAARQPFAAKEVAAAKAFCVGFLAEPLGSKERKALTALASRDDRFALDGRELYWLARLGQGQSEFSVAAFEKAVGVSVSFRSLTTIRKLTAKYGFGGVAG